jgi:hypothetical protein
LIPPRGLTIHENKFLPKLGLTINRDDKLIADIYKAKEEEEKKESEKARKEYEAEWGWLKKKKKKQ